MMSLMNENSAETDTSSLPGRAMKWARERLPLPLFVFSAAVLAFAYGMAVVEYRIFPYGFLQQAGKGWQAVLSRLPGQARLPWYYRRVDDPEQLTDLNTAQAYEGLNLVSRVAAERQLSVNITDMDGRTLHEWDVDWFRIWPDAEHIPAKQVPRARPGTFADAVVLMENGDLVFTYASLGLVRLNRDSEVVWRLPYRTHHMVHRHDNGNLWVCGQQRRTEPDPRFPNRVPPFAEYTIVVVSPEGAILQEWSISELLWKNGYGGLLHLGRRRPRQKAGGDLLHLNDVEPFPSRLEEGFFKHGDVLVSLRNVNTVFVFNRETEKIKFICTGWFVWQHDPDFIDGDRFSVFDNYTNASRPPRSRIVIVSAKDNTYEVFFEGTPETPFYTEIGGKHQWLPNGNLLITEDLGARAFEINPQGKVVWQYVNYVEPGIAANVQQVQRLPLEYADLFRSPGPGETASITASITASEGEEGLDKNSHEGVPVK